MSTTAQIRANRTNAKRSTGPRTTPGKAASSQNSTRHGLTGSVPFIPAENPQHFLDLTRALFQEHRPSTPTEEILVDRMAQSLWLTQRSLTLQSKLFKESIESSQPLDEKQMALALRYQTTHDRAFSKSLHDLLTLRKTSRQQEIGFASQKRAEQLHEAKMRQSQHRLQEQEFKLSLRQAMEAPLPTVPQPVFPPMMQNYESASSRDPQQGVAARG